jgi:hypothetical protein
MICLSGLQKPLAVIEQHGSVARLEEHDEAEVRMLTHGDVLWLRFGDFLRRELG